MTSSKRSPSDPARKHGCKATGPVVRCQPVAFFFSKGLTVYIDHASDKCEKIIKEGEKKLSKLLNIDGGIDISGGDDLEVAGPWGGVTLSTLAGNCGTLLVHDFDFTCFRKQRVDVFTLLLEMFRKLAKVSDYGCMLATTTEDQKEEEESLEKAGWKRLVGMNFKNPRSSNRVRVWGRVIR